MFIAPNPRTVTVPSAGTDSPDVDLGASNTKGPIRLMIFGPAVLTGTIITIQVAPVAAGPYVTLQNGTPLADISMTAAVKGAIVDVLGHGVFRIHSNAAEGANRDFVVFGVRMDATQ